MRTRARGLPVLSSTVFHTPIGDCASAACEGMGVDAENTSETKASIAGSREVFICGFLVADRAAPSARGFHCATGRAPAADGRRFSWREVHLRRDESPFPVRALAKPLRLVARRRCRTAASRFPRLRDYA